MVTILSFGLTLSCLQVNMKNETEFPWNSHDYHILESAKRRCGQLYKTSPCVKEFIKRGKQNYWVICGKETKNE